MGSITEGFNSMANSILAGQKIKKEKAEESAKTESIRLAILTAAGMTGDEKTVEQYSKIVDSMKGSEASEGLKLIHGDLISRIKVKQQAEAKAQAERDNPTGVYSLGQDGTLTQAGSVPGGSKVFKENLTPEQYGSRTTATEEAKYGAVKENAARAFDLRKEFQAIPEVKDYQVIKSQVSSMDALLQNVKTGDGDSALALDQGLITLFNKITDPRSVVRESEYERTPQNLSLINRFGGALEKLKQGGAGLTSQDREALVFGAKVIADSRADLYNETVSNYENLANEFGVKPELVISGFGKAKKFTENKNNKGTQVFKGDKEARYQEWLKKKQENKNLEGNK